MNHGSHRRVVPQKGRVVRVLVAGRDLVDPLPHQIDDAVVDVARIAPVRDQLPDPAGEVELLIELAQQHEPASPVISPPSKSTTIFRWNLNPDRL